MEEYRYKLIIKTLYNTIHLEVDDIENEEIREIFKQPYIIDIKIEEKAKELKKFKK